MSEESSVSSELLSSVLSFFTVPLLIFIEWFTAPVRDGGVFRWLAEGGLWVGYTFWGASEGVVAEMGWPLDLLLAVVLLLNLTVGLNGREESHEYPKQIAEILETCYHATNAWRVIMSVVHVNSFDKFYICVAFNRSCHIKHVVEMNLTCHLNWTVSTSTS